MTYEGTTETQRALQKHRWTQREDELLRKGVEDFGTKNWTKIAEGIPGRKSRQCRERWTECLNPTRKRSPWTQEEDKLLKEKQKELGTKWSTIVTFFPGRTANDIKNHYHSLQRKKSQNPQGEHLFDTLNEGFNAQSIDAKESGVDLTTGYNDVLSANEDFDRLPSSDEWLFLDDDDCGLGI